MQELYMALSNNGLNYVNVEERVFFRELIVFLKQVCDGESDCPGGEDEQNCPANHCGKDQFACSNDTCVGFGHVCNGERDCPGGEDEMDCTIQKECDAGSRCQHTCLLLSNGIFFFQALHVKKYYNNSWINRNGCVWLPKRIPSQQRWSHMRRCGRMRHRDLLQSVVHQYGRRIQL